MTIDREDMEISYRELEMAITEKNLAKINSCRHLLADAGDTESEREYAKMLERGEYQIRNIDTAMEYYRRAARKNDAYSVYKYSKLIGRASETLSKFWLRYAAILGSIDSYPDAAELFSSEEKEDIASYYYSLAAACDDTDSIVTMARRWHEGIGVSQNDSFAKWYLDKMVIPPIGAIKLAYKLRLARSAEPPKLFFPDYTSYIKELAEEARTNGLDTAYFYLVSRLAEAGHVSAEATLGMLYTEGIGCEKNLEEAKKHLDSSIAHGNPLAAVYLGQEYISGEFFEADTATAMKYFELAASLGYPEAYHKLASIYEEGTLIEKNIARAIELYERAANNGFEGARVKADELKATRNGFYSEAYNTMYLKGRVTREEAANAFRSAAIATAMGDIRAPRILAQCYAAGFGTEVSRAMAFYWFREGAERGDKESLLPLAFCYSRGYGVDFSYRDAVKYLKLADAVGAKGAAEELNLLYKRKMKKMVRSLYSASMNLIHMKKVDEAARLLASFESLAYPKALYTLGCLHEFGRGVAKCDREKADGYYRAAFVGNPAFGNFKDPNSAYKLRILKMIR